MPTRAIYTDPLIVEDSVDEPQPTNEIFRNVCSHCGRKTEKLAKLFGNSFCLNCLNRAFPIQLSPQHLDSLVYPTIQGKKFKYNTTTGVELEVIIPMQVLGDLDKTRKISSPSSWGISKDTSIHAGRDFGFEYVSPVLYKDQTLTEIKHISDILNEYPFYTNESCSFHVHVGFFTTPNLGIIPDGYYNKYKEIWYKARKTILIWSKLEALIYAMSGPDRINNKYCIPINTFFSYQDIVSIKNSVDLYHVIAGSNNYHSSKYGTDHTFLPLNYRYLSINLNSLLYRGTIEFRTHHGTTNETEIKNWVTFCTCLVENGSKLSDKQITRLQITNPDETLTMLGIPKDIRQFYINKMVNFIRKSKRSEWTPLRKILRENKESGLSAFILLLRNKITQSKIPINRNEFINSLTKYIRNGMPTTFKSRKDTYAAKLLKSVFSSAHALSIMRMQIFYHNNEEHGLRNFLKNDEDISTISPTGILHYLQHVIVDTYRYIDLDEQDRIAKMFTPLCPIFTINRMLQFINDIPPEHRKKTKNRNINWNQSMDEWVQVTRGSTNVR